MIDAIEILELKTAIVFYGYLEKTHYEELDERIKDIKKEDKLQFLINFLKNKNYKIKTVLGTKFDVFPTTIGHLV